MRIFLLCLMLVGCGDPVDRELDVLHCKAYGYDAWVVQYMRTQCCTWNGSERACLYPDEVTKHRDEIFS